MSDIIRCFILSLMLGASCQIFFETIVPLRKWRHPWIACTATMAFTAGAVVICFTRTPAFILRPVRLVIIITVIAQIYFQIRVFKNLVLSVLFCGIYWLVATTVLTVFSFFNNYEYESMRQAIENLTGMIHLCLMLTFHFLYKSRIRRLTEFHWKKLSILPFLYLTIIVAINMIPGSEAASDRYARLATISGFAILSIFLFYFTMRMLEKEETLQRLQLNAERMHNQMNMYHSMQTQYEQQKRFLHDYKNQLNCIQGLLDCGHTQEASEYITRMTGTLRAQFGDINTNHTVVNIILNQKYQTARDKKIAITFVINDLSGLTMPEEDLVTLLTNLLDNAIEACEKLDEKNPPISKVIQFKMVLEEGLLTLSVRNPVSKPVQIRNNTVITSKKDSVYHGIGLSNVDCVVKKYNGTSVLKCDDGWFSFSAILS